MLKYRSREIIATTILQLIKDNNGISRAKIMHNSLISHTQLLYYLDFLLKYELVEYDQSSKLYTITPKGLEVIELVRQNDQFVRRIPSFAGKYH